MIALTIDPANLWGQNLPDNCFDFKISPVPTPCGALADMTGCLAPNHLVSLRFNQIKVCLRQVQPVQAIAKNFAELTCICKK